MSAQNTIKFVKNLCATFHKYPITDETKDQLVFILAKQKLNEAQWAAVLNRIIENRDENDKGLPEPPEIFGAIKSLKKVKADSRDYATVTFDVNSNCFAIRCVRNGDQWISTKTKQSPAIPANAQNIFWAYDNQATPNPEDMPTSAEVRELVGKMSMGSEI